MLKDRSGRGRCRGPLPAKNSTNASRTSADLLTALSLRSDMRHIAAHAAICLKRGVNPDESGAECREPGIVPPVVRQNVAMGTLADPVGASDRERLEIR